MYIYICIYIYIYRAYTRTYVELMLADSPCWASAHLLHTHLFVGHPCHSHWSFSEDPVTYMCVCVYMRAYYVCFCRLSMPFSLNVWRCTHNVCLFVDHPCLSGWIFSKALVMYMYACKCTYNIQIHVHEVWCTWAYIYMSTATFTCILCARFIYICTCTHMNSVNACEYADAYISILFITFQISIRRIEIEWCYLWFHVW